MRQLAGGLRERDVEEFARELGALARRNPGVFLAGSVAVGFGIARFFKARAPAQHGGDHWQDGVGGWQEFGEAELERADFDARTDFDADETLDLSAGAMRRGDDASDRDSAASGAAAENLGTTSHDDERSADDRNAGKSRQSGKQSKAKAQRAAGGGSQAGEQGRDEAAERTPPAGGPTTGTRTTGTSDSTATSGGTAPSRGGKQ
jgi:hypothetical protein